MYDVFLEETINEWRSQGLPTGETPEDYFGHDFENILPVKSRPEKPNGEKFVSIIISEPFSERCGECGLEETLTAMAHEPRKMASIFNRITDNILENSSSFMEDFPFIDGAWLCGDLAYDKGLFFSPGLYKKMLFPLHRDLCAFFRSKNMDIIFHSHGDIREILPLLIEAGVKAIEPLETGAGMDALKIRKEYGRDLALFGNIGFDKLKASRESFALEVERKLDFLKQDGGYVYRMDKDITPDIKFEDYKFAAETVKKIGYYGWQ